MAVRSKRLAEGTRAAGAGTIYTCPAGETTIVKTVTLYNTNAAANPCAMSLRVGGAGGDYWVVQAAPATNALIVVTTWLILHPTDILRLTATNSSIIYSLHGTELEGVAD